jgi:hypothetical protein
MLLEHLATSVEVFLALPHPIPKSLNQCSIPLDLSLMSRLHLATIRRHPTLPPVLSEAGGPSAARFPRSSMPIPGSRAAPHPRTTGARALRFGLVYYCVKVPQPCLGGFALIANSA